MKYYVVHIGFIHEIIGEFVQHLDRICDHQSSGHCRREEMVMRAVRRVKNPFCDKHKTSHQ